MYIQNVNYKKMYIQNVSKDQLLEDFYSITEYSGVYFDH